MGSMVEFDFEKETEKMLPKLDDPNEYTGFKLNDQKHRIIVCRHWLLGLCHNGITCSYLHRLDKSKMPPCKHGKLCKIKNCPLKHVADEELEECIFYKQGFCCNGPKCTRRHVKRMPEDCPAEATFDSGATTTLGGKKLKPNQVNDNFKVTLWTHWLMNGVCPFDTECHFAHGEEEINEGYQANSDFLIDGDIYDPTANQMSMVLDLPFPTNRLSYFIFQSPDLRSLCIARRRGVWSAPIRMMQELNTAFRNSDHVIIYFSVRALRGIYGVAKLAGQVPPSLNPSPLTPEFPITWLRTLRLSLRTVAQLKLGNTGMFVGRSPSDGRFENKVGLDMLLICYRKPAWDWTLELEQAEANARLTLESSGITSTSSQEYYPAGGVVPYYLPPDQLFAPEWVERAQLMPHEKGIMKFGAGSASDTVYGPGAAAAAANAPLPDFYTGAHPGFIFCAAPQIIEEMFAKFLFGLPPQLSDVVIHPNVPLFIFDTVAQVMLGIFYADSPTQPNIDPNAFLGWNPAGGGGAICTLPIQLKFRIALEAMPIPIMDPELQAALGEALQTLGGPLGPTETKKVANLFNRRVHQQMLARLGPASGAAGGGGGAVGRPKLMAGGVVGAAPGNGLYYKPPFKFVDTVVIDIPGPVFEIKKKLLGVNASAIIAIVDELGSKYTVRIRLRGLGSGFTEGPTNTELPEPLHFNISAENEPLLRSVVSRVQQHVDRCRMELTGGMGMGYR